MTRSIALLFAAAVFSRVGTAADFDRVLLPIPTVNSPLESPPVDVAWLLNRDPLWLRTLETVADQDIPEPETAPAPPANAATTRVDVGELFLPVGALTASIKSSAPPQLPEGRTADSLDRPQDEAGAYEQHTIPVYYTTMGYGVRRAPRNTHCFRAHPLYFEDPNLERCGRSHGGCTATCSALHFALQTAMLPALMLHDHPDDCVRMLPDCPTCHKFPCDVTCPGH